MIRRYCVSLAIVMGLLGVFAYAWLDRQSMASEQRLMMPPIVQMPSSGYGHNIDVSAYAL